MHIASGIRSATLSEAGDSSVDWAFVDVGFANDAKSCGLLHGAGEPRNLRFSDLAAKLVQISHDGASPLNLLLEAPLSVAFNANGNPTPRFGEKRDTKVRYWYLGLGCAVLVGATYLLRAIYDGRPAREIRLVEGFVSFKPKGVASSHAADVTLLRDLALGRNQGLGRLVSPDELRLEPSDRLESAFKVAGMDFGVPPMLVIGA